MAGQTPEPIADDTKPLCFVIGPYGKDGTPARRWSDFLFRRVIHPVAGSDYFARRTIDDPKPGEITRAILSDLEQAPLVIADLTDLNPNAFYELGFRHASGRPFVHIC